MIVVSVSVVALSACARTTLLVNRDEESRPAATSATGTTSTATPTPTTPITTTTTAPPGPAATAYLAALSREQAKLAAAERRIPRRARTPAALARSIRLLRLAIVRLGRDLTAISPPEAVSAQHAQLVSIVRTYAARLRAAARVAARPRGKLRGVNMLIDATTAASSAFGATVSEINAALKH